MGLACFAAGAREVVVHTTRRCRLLSPCAAGRPFAVDGRWRRPSIVSGRYGRKSTLRLMRRHRHDSLQSESASREIAWSAAGPAAADARQTPPRCGPDLQPGYERGPGPALCLRNAACSVVSWRKPVVDIVVIVQRDTDIVQIAGALRATPRFAGRLHGGQ